MDYKTTGIVNLKKLRPKHKLSREDAMRASHVLFMCHLPNGEREDRFLEPFEIGGAFLLDSIEEMFVKLRKERGYITYKYGIWQGYEKITDLCTNPLHVENFTKKQFGDMCRYLGVGIYFHTDPNKNVIDEFK